MGGRVGLSLLNFVAGCLRLAFDNDCEETFRTEI